MIATQNAVGAVVIERTRQELLKSQGRFAYTCADDGLIYCEKLAVLTEEIGEVARQCLGLASLTSDGNPATVEQLREELIHTAAVAVAWIESLDDALSARL